MSCVLCMYVYSDMVRNLLPRSAMNLDKPILSPFWSSSFSFGKCHAEKKVPYDPNYLYLSIGDEFSKYARLWTRGYDVYTPNKVLVAHDDSNQMGTADGVNTADQHAWVRSGMKDTYRWQMYEVAINRMKTLLGTTVVGKDTSRISALTHFGLGMARTLDQLIEFTGIDTRRKIVFGDR